MAEWKSTLNVKDVFHNDDIPAADRHRIIAKRIRRLPQFDENSFACLDIVEGIEHAEDVVEFDGWWSEFYNWADAERVWVVTR